MARSLVGNRALVHSGRVELVLDALEVIEPLDRVVELGAFLLGKLLLHLVDRLGELGAIEIRQRLSNLTKEPL